MLLLLLLAGVSTAQVIEESIICPFPDPSTTTPEASCPLYTACALTGTNCHMGLNNDVGYTVASSPRGTPTGYYVNLTKTNPSSTMFGDDIIDLRFEVINHFNHHSQIKIYDMNNPQYEVPFALNQPTEPVGYDLSIEVSDEGTPFSFTVTRLATGNVVFQSIGPLTYENQFIQFTTSFVNDYIYGFGENIHTTFKTNFSQRTTTPMFARDQPVDVGYNEYGVHPYYVNIEDDDGNTHSVLFYNSNAMEYSTFTIAPNNTPALTLRTIGGLIDLHFFAGPSPEEVNMQYASTVGYPTFPPYYAMGFHLSKYGYNTLDNVKAVRKRMREAKIPQDVQTFDIDYMDRRRDFTYDTFNWSGFPEFIHELHAENVKTTLMFDPAVVIDIDNYEPYQRGVQADAFIRWADPDDIPSDQESYAYDYIVGYVWPDNKTVFPDFFYQPAMDWWTDEVQRFKQVLDFDNIWIDMNEPASFGTGTDRPFNYPEELPDWSLKCPNNELDSPPYPTLAAYVNTSESRRISDKTICMSGVQRYTSNDMNYTHYDVHSLYGLSEALATHETMEVLFPGKRHLLLSRSTFPGSGRFTTHWLGDNTASWDHLRWSIIGMLEFNLFAIPMVGADVCGFFNEPSEELCARWMQLGAFYPFDRNHGDLDSPDQDPAREDWPQVREISRNVLLLRYKYIPFLYTLFYKANMYGESVVRPLFNIYPTDLAAREIDDQFFWGSDLMVSPVLDEGAEDREVYFPESIFYKLITGELAAIGPVTLTVEAPLEVIPVYIRGGAILPYQEPDVTTALSRLNPFGFTVALDPEGVASGFVFYDDGESASLPDDEKFAADIYFANNTFSLEVVQGENAAAIAGITLNDIVIFGLQFAPMSVTFDRQPISSVTSYDDTNSVFKLSMTGLPLGGNITINLIP